MIDELAHFRENACRANLSPYEIAARAAHLMDLYGCTVAQLSKQIGVPEGTIRSLVSILSRLPQPIIEAWKQGARELDRAHAAAPGRAARPRSRAVAVD